MMAAYRFLILGLLFWILADVSAMHHTANASLNHNWWTAVGSVCLVWSFGKFLLAKDGE